MASSKNIAKTKENSKTVTKSILRNPEVTLGSNKRVSINDFRFNHDDNGDIDEDSQILHQPRVNKLAEMRKTLHEIRNYEARELTSMDDLNKKTQDIINRAVSSNLNFKSTQAVFKNLPSINNGEQQQQTQKIQRRPEQIEKSEKRDDIIKYIKDMMIETESIDDRNCLEQREFINLAGEDDFLGICKLKNPQFLMHSSKSESKRFQKAMIDDLYNAIGLYPDKYHSKVSRFVPPPPTHSHAKREDSSNNEKSCRCLGDFYMQHLNCS